MNARFHAPAAEAGTVIALPDEEARHLARVLRLTAGAAVAVFDGRGHEFAAVVEHVSGDRVDVRVGAPRDAAAEPRVAITLAQAVLKGEKMDDVVRDAVMIGVAAIQPLLTVRTEISAAAIERGRRQQRWQRIAVSSAKQCGRAVVPAILQPIAFERLPAAIEARGSAGVALILVEPNATAGAVRLADVDPTPPRAAIIVIGPEGGWTAEEIAAAAGACQPVTLGARTLRAEAMATIAIAALFTRWNEF